MKVLIIAHSRIGGGNGRCNAFRNFLVSRGLTVDTVYFPGENISPQLWYYYQHGLSLVMGHEMRNIRKTADRLEKIIKTQKYDAVIGIETPRSYVLTRDLKDCLKVFSCESLMADEFVFSRGSRDIKKVRDLREIELEIFHKADYVVFPWKTTEDYVRKHIWNGNNFVTIKYGCYPKKKIASYFFPYSIISLGNSDAYWSNPELIASLTQASPYAIDVYGKDKPAKKYHLNYKGYASSLDILKNYQFGLNTVSKDAFRRSHHSSRILSYLAYGLPVLSVDWLQFSHELKGVLPFNKENFLEIIDSNSEPEKWEKLSNAAYEQAIELDWNKVLVPLENLLES
jgi:hypothetical protein